MPGEVFQRHNNCNCSLDYNGKKLTAYEKNGKAHSFREDPNEQEKIEARKGLARRNDDRNNGLKVSQTGGKITGGHHYIADENEGKRGREAAKQYEKYSREDDSAIIAKNTGFSVEDIEQIRSHVFFRKHDLDDGYERFASDYDMAVAWKRLQNGNYLPRDITLLNHELLESKIEKEYNITAREAHELATETYDWAKQMLDETKGKGEADGLL